MSENNNVQPIKGFRQKPAPTKGEIQEENFTLSKQLEAKVTFLMNLVQQIANRSRATETEVDALANLAACTTLGGDATIDKGDNVLIDFLGVLLKENGTPEQDADGLPAYSESMYGIKHLVQSVGRGSLIPGFEDQLIGKKTGDTFEITLKFPEEYQEKAVAGKGVMFLVHVQSIHRLLPISKVQVQMEAYRLAKKSIAEERAKKEAEAKAAEVAAASENKGPGADSIPSTETSLN